ncbi:hypothetical protein HDU85_006623 [Gaertneriomyces sp. JEL0708]|nr:hypothetical protein HDU85_006623 [Gaertneriomyces sp. JEL0708]
MFEVQRHSTGYPDYSQHYKREPLQSRRLFSDAHFAEQYQQHHSFTYHHQPGYHIPRSALYPVPSGSHRSCSSSSAKRSKNVHKLAIATHTLPPACPPPAKPLPIPPRPSASPLQQYPYPDHIASQYHHAPPQYRSQSNTQPSRTAYPSPATTPQTPETVAERHLRTSSLQAVFASRYQIGQELGSGGFGFVCSATRKADGQEVAVKFILKTKVPAQGWAWDPECGVIPMEVFMLKNIKHQNIITFLDFYEDTTFFYLVTELHGAPWTSSRTDRPSLPSALSLPSPITPHGFPSIGTSTPPSGGLVTSCAPASPPLSPVMPKLTRRPSMDLFECIEQHDRLTEDQARKVFRQIISAIQYLHSLGVVHRDIKDENILVDSDFRVKIVDFGSAAYIPQLPGGKLFDRFLGTIQYAAPEILRGEKYRGPEAEIWALGCCLYIMLNGEVPFSTPAQAAQQPYSEPKHSLSAECRELLDAMLEKKASVRATILDVASHPWLVM